MLNYHYDPETKQYTGSTEARPDPMEYELQIAQYLFQKGNPKKLPSPVKFLLPQYATRVAPPENYAPTKAPFFNGTGWVLEDLPPALPSTLAPEA